MKSGIYTIENIENGHFYIGQSVNIKNRWALHRHYLRKGVSTCYVLQKAWNKYGELTFRFRVLLVCDPKNLNLYENILINSLKPQYNMAPANENLSGGSALSDAARAKISKARTGKERPPHVGKAVGDANRKRIVSQETREKMRKRMLGTKQPEAFKSAMSKRFSGQGNPMFGKPRSGADNPCFGRPAKNRVLVRNTTTGEVYSSMKEAATVLGVSIPAVSSAVNKGSLIKRRIKLERISPVAVLPTVL